MPKGPIQISRHAARPVDTNLCYNLSKISKKSWQSENREFTAETTIHDINSANEFVGQRCRPSLFIRFKPSLYFTLISNKLQIKVDETCVRESPNKTNCGGPVPAAAAIMKRDRNLAPLFLLQVLTEFVLLAKSILLILFCLCQNFKIDIFAQLEWDRSLTEVDHQSLPGNLHIKMKLLKMMKRLHLESILFV